MVSGLEFLLLWNGHLQSCKSPASTLQLKHAASHPCLWFLPLQSKQPDFLPQVLYRLVCGLLSPKSLRCPPTTLTHSWGCHMERAYHLPHSLRGSLRDVFSSLALRVAQKGAIKKIPIQSLRALQREDPSRLSATSGEKLTKAAAAWQLGGPERNMGTKCCSPCVLFHQHVL